ncbi:MFS transporter [Paenibacillus sp. CGMCC 1.16610]|uniref:MFS transporter n=1 Tax=Paenibacillus anseongense TaxID=2682845 RepID=A0ABW9UED9_9BACL|nr:MULTISPECIES: MFS transporter [Paenibacillus]MBA2937148.1 MFS transporter [Paenibacillus sp. CGMCC 1.16610]MVQ36210.1 MFS transporter [Paenibacillus anseongense]
MKVSARIALLSMAVTTTFGTMMAAPAVKPLAVAFPNTDALLVQWVVTLSSLFILPTLFLSGTLGRRFNRKTILITALILYLIGGVGPAFMHSFNMILVCRAILGLSIGLISPTFNSLIAENFHGNDRSRMNGLQTSINGIGGAIFLSIGGFIASLGWRDVFMTYLYAVVLLLVVIIFLPKFPPLQVSQSTKSSEKMPKFFYAVAIAGGLHTMLFALLPTNLSLFIANNGIGSVASAGYLIAFSLIGVFIGGLSVTRLTGAFQKKLVPLVLGLMAGGFLLISSAHTEWSVALAVFMIGLAEGVLFPLSFIKTSEVVPKLILTTGISLLLACVYICQFLSPLFVRGVEVLLHSESTRDVFMAVAIALVVAAVAFLVSVRNKSRSTAHSALDNS